MKKSDLQYSNSLLYAAGLLVKAEYESYKKVYKELNIGVSHEDFIILEIVYLNPGILQADVTKKTLINRSYVCKLLNRLIDNGYVRTEQAIRGKRQITIKNYITNKGLELYNKINDYLYKKAIDVYLNNFSEKDLEKSEELKSILLDRAQKIIKECNLKFY